jgi:hypothetical protein
MSSTPLPTSASLSHFPKAGMQDAADSGEQLSATALCVPWVASACWSAPEYKRVYYCSTQQQLHVLVCSALRCVCACFAKEWILVINGFWLIMWNKHKLIPLQFQPQQGRCMGEKGWAVFHHYGCKVKHEHKQHSSDSTFLWYRPSTPFLKPPEDLGNASNSVFSSRDWL